MFIVWKLFLNSFPGLVPEMSASELRHMFWSFHVSFSLTLSLPLVSFVLFRIIPWILGKFWLLTPGQWGSRLSLTPIEKCLFRGIVFDYLFCNNNNVASNSIVSNCVQSLQNGQGRERERGRNWEKRRTMLSFMTLFQNESLWHYSVLFSSSLKFVFIWSVLRKKREYFQPGGTFVSQDKIGKKILSAGIRMLVCDWVMHFGGKHFTSVCQVKFFLDRAT